MDYVLSALLILGAVWLVKHEIRHWKRVKREEKRFRRVMEHDLAFRAKEYR